MSRGEPERSEGDERGATGASSPSLVRGSMPCELWGVLNVTPDSFSDGGRYDEVASAVEHGRQMLEQGADVIDVGGESSRPAGKTYGDGFSHVSADEETRRVVPVIERLCQDLGARVSIDTVKPAVARAALAAGATIVNDVSCGRDEALFGVVAEAEAELVLMHTRGRGEVGAAQTTYGDVVADVLEELLATVERAVAAGVSREAIWLDPGIGFAKTAPQSAALLGAVPAFVATGHRLLLGPSRKSFIAELAPSPAGDEPSPTERAGGTAAAVTAGVFGGAHAVRVHDVALMRQAVRVAQGIAASRPGAAS